MLIFSFDLFITHAEGTGYLLFLNDIINSLTHAGKEMWGTDNDWHVCHCRCPTCSSINQWYMLSTARYSEKNGEEGVDEWDTHGVLYSAEQSICKQQCDPKTFHHHGCLSLREGDVVYVKPPSSVPSLVSS